MGRLGKYLFFLACFILLCYGGLVWYVNTEVEKGLNNAVAQVDGLSLTYDDMWVDLGDQTVTITKPVTTLPSGEHFIANELIIYAFDERHNVPHFIKAQAKGLVVQAKDAQRLGLPVTEDLFGDMLLDYRYNPAGKVLTINTLSFDDAKFGNAIFSGTITELDLDAFRVEKLIGLHIKDMELEFTDRSFMEALFTQAGAQAAVSKGLARKQASRELQAFADFGDKQGKPEAAKAIRGLKEFVDNSGTVTIKATPAKPVPYIYLFMGRDIFDNINLLNLSIETRQGERNNQ